MSSADERHREATEQAFTRQAPSFEREGSLFADTSILRWIAGRVAVPPGGLILDVAGGTGQVGRYLARNGAVAVVVDLTQEMLEVGRRAVSEEGRRDVVFVRGDAAGLPFPAAHFDLVISRFALHHVRDPAAVVREMKRVCRAGGEVAVIDIVGGGQRHDEIERLRDPSHVRTLTVFELRELFTATGMTSVHVDQREQSMAVEPWLERAATPDRARRAIREVLRLEANGGPSSGLCAEANTAGGLTVTQRWMLVRGLLPRCGAAPLR